MSFLTDFFGSKYHSTAFPFGKHPKHTINTTDVSGEFKADTKLLNSVWHGENNAYNLAQGLIYTPIARPCQLIGIPQPVSDDKATQDAANEILDQFSDEFPVMEQTKQVHGTQWRFPRWDSKRNALAWEYISDDSVEQIEVDILSGELTGIWTHDFYTVANGEINSQTLERKRHFTRSRIDVQWITKGNIDLQDQSQRNMFGVLPLPNGHECDAGEWRGYSVIGRSLRLIKSYHDVMRNANQILAEFEPKWVQTVKDVKTWLANNGFTEANAVVEASDAAYGSHFQINLDGETTEYMFMPTGAMSQYETILKRIRTEIIASGPVPEIFYGNLATGNEASVDSSIQQITSYVDTLRKENIAFYEDLFNASLQIRGYVENRSYSKVHVEYGRLDMLSETQKADIFSKTATGISACVTSASFTKADIYYLWKGLYPSLPEKTLQEFTDGLEGMIIHKAKSNADAGMLSDINAQK